MKSAPRSPENVTALISVTGKLPTLSAKSLGRLSVFVAQGGTILGESPLNPAGKFQFHLVHALAKAEDVVVVLGPKGLDSQALSSHPDLPRVALASGKTERNAIHVDFTHLGITDELLEPWWIWCREYTISGTLLTAAGCPIGAEVTIYNVSHGVGGLVKTPLAIVPTDSNGNFAATFNWCSWRFCGWPCWPVWWNCWPWWWELDILAVLENLEHRLQRGPGASVTVSSIAPLRQPNAADLMTGIGFAALRPGAALQPNSARTALIATKLAHPAIREIFPWWWWCCENPNIVCSASQGATVILDEDPNISTRWCFPSGQSVSLTGGSASLGSCQVQTGGPCGFGWSSVGNELVDDISMGYAQGSTGSACSNLAFDGGLSLNGIFSGDCAAFYQVLSGQWGGGGGAATAGNPARGGTTPASYPQLSNVLTDTITIWTGTMSTQVSVVLGPCSFNGMSNLYMTRAFRQNPPAGVTGLPAFPTIPPGALWGWNAPDEVLTVPAATLISPAASGGATLQIAAYDIAGNSLPHPPAEPFTLGPDLTLAIDTTSLVGAGGASAPTIDWVKVYNQDGTPAAQTTGSSTECPAYRITTPGGGYVLLHTTVVDNAANLREYHIVTQYGAGSTQTATPSGRDYAQPPATFTPPSGSQLYGVDAGYAPPNDAPPPPPPPQVPAAANWTFSGGGDTFYIPITQSCCYDFQLWVSKRTTDGQSSTCVEWNPTFQTVNIVVASAT
jgi:hypothetical protein